MYKGIDYGNGKTNIDKNGVRFGVISQNAVCQAFFDTAEAEYSNACPFCGNKPKGKKRINDLHHCGSCRKVFSESDFYDQESLCYYIDDGEYKAFSDSHGDIMILKSPFFTYAQFCSPCCPGGCHLENPLPEPDENNKCYCFGHDFFPDSIASYPVYSLETGELICADLAKQ